MKKLSRSGFNKCVKCIEKHSRNLEKTILNTYFFDGDKESVINELKLHQNADGGFGHALEPDFQMPKSSPMASTTALQVISKLNLEEQCSEMIKKCIGYFEKTYNEARKGWYAVSKEVNNYHHASWWNYNSEYGMTIIDDNWGNPTAEIIAYLYKYQEYVQELKVEELLANAIDYLLNKTEFASYYEVYCYIRLYNVLPLSYQERIKDKLTLAVSEVLCDDESHWHEFVPYPLRIVKSPTDESFKIDQCLIEKNLDFLVDYIEENMMMMPDWQWDDCLEDSRITDWNLAENIQGWEKAENDWIGVLTLEVLMVLSAFERIED